MTSVLRATTDALRRSQPAAILFSGDLLYGTKSIQQACEYLADLAAIAPLWMSPGNHEHRRDYPFTRLLAQLTDAGARVLCNANDVWERDGARIWIAGVDDPHIGSADLPTALEGVPEDSFSILLAHSPDMHDLALQAGVDLMLSGHTHGGQVRLPGIGPLYTNVRRTPRAWCSGATQLSPRTYMLVSRGLGVSSMPWRFRCSPQLPLITLRLGANVTLRENEVAAASA